MGPAQQRLSPLLLLEILEELWLLVEELAQAEIGNGVEKHVAKVILSVCTPD